MHLLKIEKVKRSIPFILVGVMILVSYSSCKKKAPKTVKTAAITFTQEGYLKIYKGDSDTTRVELDIEIADTDYETQTGLMYRESMEEKQGMLFIFPETGMHSFYMKNTRIPLDIIFIDADYRIASFQKNTIPENESGLSSKVPVRYVLEINAGLADVWSLEIGDKVDFSRISL